METTLYDLKGQEAGKVTLPEMFETRVSPALLHEVVVGFLANQRAGTAKTKSRGEVSGGGAKPWKQKGTGNARSGSNRSPLWRKGGIIFGPRPRSYFQNIPQQKRRLSLEMALASKAKDGKVMIVDGFTVSEPKTKKIAEILRNLKLENSRVLVVADKFDTPVKTASRNIPDLVLVPATSINTYLVLWADKVVLTRSGLEKLEKKSSAAPAK